MRLALNGLIFGLLGVLFTACFDPKDFDVSKLTDAGLDYDVALPLTETRLTMENLMDLQGGLLIPDEDGLLHIIYSMEPVPARFVGDVAFSEGVSIEVGSGTLPYYRLDNLLEMECSDSVRVGFSGFPQGTEVRKLYLEASRWDLVLENRFLDPMDMEIVFANMAGADGNPVSVTRTVEANQSLPLSVDLENVMLTVSGRDEFYVDMRVSSRVDMRGMTQDSSLHYGSCVVRGTMGKTVFSRMDGYAGNSAYAIEGELPISGLGLDRMENIDFREASIVADLKVEGVSAPLRIDQSTVDIHNRTGISGLPLFPENYMIRYPSIDADPMVKESTEEASFVNTLIDRPEKVSFSLSGRLNPDEDRTVLQALERNAAVSVALSCDLPLWFSADRYVLCDTVSIRLDKIGDDTKVNYFLLKSILKNAFPLDMDVTIRFLDEAYGELFVLCRDRRVSAAGVGPEPDLHVDEPAVAAFDDELDEEEVLKVKETAYVEIFAKISSLEKEDVKIYAPSEKESFLDIKIGFRAKTTQL